MHCTPEKRRNGSDSLPCALKARQKYLKDASIGYRCPTSVLRSRDDDAPLRNPPIATNLLTEKEQATLSLTFLRLRSQHFHAPANCRLRLHRPSSRANGQDIFELEVFISAKATTHPCCALAVPKKIEGPFVACESRLETTNANALSLIYYKRHHRSLRSFGSVIIKHDSNRHQNGRSLATSLGMRNAASDITCSLGL